MFIPTQPGLRYSEMEPEEQVLYAPEDPLARVYLGARTLPCMAEFHLARMFRLGLTPIHLQLPLLLRCLKKRGFHSKRECVGTWLDILFKLDSVREILYFHITS